MIDPAWLWIALAALAGWPFLGCFVLAAVDKDGALLRWYEARLKSRALFDLVGLLDLFVQFVFLFLWPVVAAAHWWYYSRHIKGWRR